MSQNVSISATGKVKRTGQSSLNLPTQRGQGYSLQKLRENHHLVLRLAALGTYTYKEIANMLGVSEVMVGYTVNSELGQQKLQVFRGEADLSVIDVLGQYAELAPLAVDVMEQIMLSSSSKDADRLRAAENITGGAGYGKRDRIDVFQHFVSDDEIEEAKRLSRQKGREVGLVVEDAVILEEEEEEDAS